MDKILTCYSNDVNGLISLRSLSYPLTWRDKGTPWPDLVEALARLPVKSLIRFLCVSKTWYLTVKDKTFCVMHLNNNNKISILCERNKNADDVIPLVFTANMPSEDLSTPYFHLNPSSQVSPVTHFTLFQVENCLEQNVIEPPLHCSDPGIIGIINGLVCIVQDHSWVVLWNPATKEAYNVPTPAINPLRTYITYGFGLDMVNQNDYKIVRVTYCRDFYPCVEIYSYLKSSWTVCSQPSPFTWYLYGSKCSVILDGVAYWRADERDTVEFLGDAIVGFFGRCDTFRAIEMPKLADKYAYWMLGTVGQALAIGLQRGHMLEILSLKDNGWSKVFRISRTIVNVDNWVPCFSSSMVVAMKSGKFFVGRTCSGDVSYPHHGNLLLFDDVFEFSESLVSPRSNSPFIHEIFTRESCGREFAEPKDISEHSEHNGCLLQEQTMTIH